MLLYCNSLSVLAVILLSNLWETIFGSHSTYKLKPNSSLHDSGAVVLYILIYQQWFLTPSMRRIILRICWLKWAIIYSSINKSLKSYRRYEKRKIQDISDQVTEYYYGVIVSIFKLNGSCEHPKKKSDVPSMILSCCCFSSSFINHWGVSFDFINRSLYLSRIIGIIILQLHMKRSLTRIPHAVFFW